MHKQSIMFTTQDLPLFSATPQRVILDVFTEQEPEPEQLPLPDTQPMTHIDFVKAQAQKYGIFSTHFPMSPDTRLSFYLYHKNGRGYSTLIETDSLHDSVYLPCLYKARSLLTNPYARKQVMKSVSDCAAEQRQQAKDFMAVMVMFLMEWDS